MSIGISPCFPEPAEVIQSDDGHDYLSFRLNSVSECGKHQTRDISRAWKYPDQFKQDFPAHPFCTLMDFSKHAKGAKSQSDWIEKAASFFGISRDSVRKDFNRVSALEHELPESPLTYVICYIVNRWAAIDWAKNSIPKTLVNAGSSIVMLDGNLAESKKLQLLSYI